MFQGFGALGSHFRHYNCLYFRLYSTQGTANDYALRREDNVSRWALTNELRRWSWLLHLSDSPERDLLQRITLTLGALWLHDMPSSVAPPRRTCVS